MKKISLIILLIVYGYSINYGQINSTAPIGSGSLADPYQISTLENLSWLTQNYIAWNKYYIQVEDINASFTATWDDADDNGDGDKYNDPNDLTSEGTNDGWLPIELFNGSYDGHEKVIDSLTINRKDVASGLGFFKVISGGTIENMGLTNVDIKGKVLVGVLAATCKENIVTNCYTTGNVTLTSEEKAYKFGGFFANIISGISEISKCHSEVKINGTQLSYYIGGFVGNIKGVPAGSITDCYSAGDILNGGQSCGGFVGKNEAEEFVVDKCYSIGNINSAERAGGFVGYNKSKAVISNCYSYGNITCTSEKETDFAGFCGYNNKSEIEKSYSIGSVIFTNPTDSTDLSGHGFVGRNKGTVSVCFFDSLVSNQSSDPSAIGKSTIEMMTESTFTDSSWDFTNIWEIVEPNNNYPTFKTTIVSVEKNEKKKIYTEYVLKQNYPNPFNPTTVISYAIPTDGMIKVSIYNSLGQEVKVLINRNMRAGSYSTQFDGSKLSSGIYFYKLQTNDYSKVRKMMLLK